MSKINIFSLGGLNENGKNMYIIEVDKELYVMDAGLKFADESMFGIDYVIPNIEFLKENKKRIKGIFITHAHDENSGALVDIIKDLNGVNVYGAKFTIESIKRDFEDSKISTACLNVIQPYKLLSFGKVKIFPVGLSHSMPDNLGYAIYTKDGVIFYASDFVFDALMRGRYQTDIGKLAYIGKQDVLCLLTESIYADKVGHTAPNHRISNLIRETLNKSRGRIIFNVLNSHLYRIQELFNEVSKTDRKIVIMGKRLQNIIKYSIENNYLHINKKIIGDLSNINDETLKEIDNNSKALNENEKIHLSLPMFKYDYEIPDFIEILNNLGVTNVFNQNVADLSNMIKSKHENFYVNQAIHKTHIDLNEKGTKAAAVTAFMIDKSSAMIEQEEKIIEIKFDKPFAYIIRDAKTKEILFFGVVYEPVKWEGSTCK